MNTITITLGGGYTCEMISHDPELPATIADDIILSAMNKAGWLDGARREDWHFSGDGQLSHLIRTPSGKISRRCNQFARSVSITGYEYRMYSIGGFARWAWVRQ
jgi:hypothetical protein